MSLLSKIANAFRGERLNREIEEELEAHIADAIEDGRDPAEARKALGSAVRFQQQIHDIRVLGWLESLRADFIFGWRQLKRNKVTSAAAVLSLALAIGACTSAFRLIDALLLRPLPISHPERLYVLSRKGMGFDNKPGEWDSWAYPSFQLMRQAAKGQAELIAVSYTLRTDLTYKTDAEMEKAKVQYVSGWMFSAFGIQPALGRLFTEDDDAKPNAAPYAVISYEYWKHRFGRDPDILGRTFHFGDAIYQIVGVSEEKFTGTEPGTMVDIFVPTMMHENVTRGDTTWIRTLVVLTPGVALEPLRAKLAAISHRFEENRLRGETGLSQETLRNVLANEVLMTPAPNGASGLQHEYKEALTAIAILVILVLLIACANVANLMTARAVARTRELAVRVSIGAGHWRLIQMVLAESALMAFLAATGGALFAWWSAPFVVSMINPRDNPVQLILPADWRVIGFGVLLTFGVVMLFGLLPALRTSSVKPVSVLKGGENPHSRQRLMYGMIGLQVSFCFLVLFVAGLFVATFEHLSNKPTGFSVERLLLLKSVSKPEKAGIYWEQVADHLRTIPGVEQVARSGWPLLYDYSWNDSISVNGGPPSIDLAYFLNISPGWLETMKMPLLQGRDFSIEDKFPGSAIVNQTFAREFLHDEHPVGRVFEKSSDDGSRERLQVVGVVQDAAYSNIHGPILPMVYVPFKSLPQTSETFVVRTAMSNPLSLAQTLRREVTAARSEFRVSNVMTQLELKQAQTLRERLLAILAFFFGAVALMLAGVGLYGVLNYSVQQGEREIGIRMALGAQMGNIIRPILGGISAAVVLGIAAGLTFGLSSTRYIQSLLYQVKTTDTGLLLIPLAIILLIFGIAALPAIRRALRVDPVAMLRAE